MENETEEPTNQPPVALPETIVATEDGPIVTGQLEASDPDGDPLTFSPILTFAPGVPALLIQADGSYSLDPSDPGYQSLAEGEVGEFLGGYFVYDGTDTHSTTITILVTGVNDAPVFEPSILEFAAYAGTPADFSVSATDIDGDPLEYSAADPDHGTVTGGEGGRFVYTPDPGFLGIDTIVLTVSDGNGGTDTKSMVVTVNPPPAEDWHLLAPKGYDGTIGGSGQVFGDSGYQHIAILDLPGSISLDPSFNRGSDIVRLPGDAADWQVMRMGSAAVFSDGDTFVHIPMGQTGAHIAFDDGNRTLFVDIASQSAMIGEQAFGSDLVPITAPDDQVLPPGGPDPQATAQLLIASDASATASGKLDVFGAAGSETLDLFSGSITLDPSFNHGGDTLALHEVATDFTAQRIGSSVFLDGTGIDALIPIGPNGMTLAFSGGDERTLLYDDVLGQILIGDQQIGTDPVALAAIA